MLDRLLDWRAWLRWVWVGTLAATGLALAYPLVTIVLMTLWLVNEPDDGMWPMLLLETWQRLLLTWLSWVLSGLLWYFLCGDWLAYRLCDLAAWEDGKRRGGPMDADPEMPLYRPEYHYEDLRYQVFWRPDGGCTIEERMIKRQDGWRPGRYV